MRISDWSSDVCSSDRPWLRRDMASDASLPLDGGREARRQHPCCAATPPMPASPDKTMRSPSSHPVKAVLGPTNTGKTHLAVERLTAHASGMMGFPLRLLAREVYDRVVAIKGPAQVALVTGEERVMPPDARYLLGPMEALPVGDRK